MSAKATTEELHIIFGTGPLGIATMRALAKMGKRVRMVNRSGHVDLPVEGIEVVKGDANDPEAVRHLAQGATTVYAVAQPAYTEWPTKFPPLMRSIVEGTAEAGARLVFGDNLYMYGPVAAPIREDMPYKATGHKGRTRAQIANMVMEAHRSGKLKVAIGRGSNFYGPYVLGSTVGEGVFGSALEGNAADVLGKPDLPHTFTFINDFGTGLATLGTHDKAFGEVWHIPNAPVITQREFVGMVFQEIGKPVKMRVGSRPIITLMGLFNPMIRETKEVLYEFEEPYIVDSRKYTQAFGGTPTSYSEAIKQTVEWYKGRGETK